MGSGHETVGTTSAIVPLGAALLGFCFFVMNWGHARLKDWEAMDEPPASRAGSPALVCWIVSMGQYICCIVGMHIFGFIAFARSAPIDVSKALVLIVAMIHYIVTWAFFGNTLWWFVRHRGQLACLTREMLGRLWAYETYMWFAIPCCLSGGIGFLVMFSCGESELGLSGVVYLLFAIFAPGAYAAIRGDFLPRAVIDHCSPSPEPSPA